MKKYIAPFLLLCGVLLSCDVVEAPYKETVDTPIDTTKKYVQKVLIEDYTGMNCGWCPGAADEAKKLHDLYKGRAVVIAVHAGFFAKPKANQYDFRTEAGTAWDTFFGNSAAGNPNGMINRMGFPQKSHIASIVSWGGKVSQALLQEPSVGITLEPTFNTANNTLSLETTVEFLKATDQDANLGVYLVEDSIVQYQLDYRKNPEPNVPDFTHMHVLRAAINSTWGDQLSTTAIPAGSVFKKNYSYTIPVGKDWKPKNMKIIAFVHRNSTTYEVMNVEEVKLLE